MPEIAREFHVHPGQVQQLLSLFLLAYGGSQFLYGPLSDRIGRRPVILASVCLYSFAAWMAAFAFSISSLKMWTFLLGAGIGSGGLMSRTMIRDLFHGATLKKAMALVGMTLTFVPLVIPILGAKLGMVYGWRSTYLFMSFSGIFYGCFAWIGLKESNPYKNTSRSPWLYTFQAYAEVLSSTTFMRNVLTISLNCGAYMAYQISLPFLLQNTLHMTSMSYALLSIIPLFGFMAGPWSKPSILVIHSVMRQGFLAMNRYYFLIGYQHRSIINFLLKKYRQRNDGNKVFSIGQ